MKMCKLSLVTALLLGSFVLSSPVAHAAPTTNQTAKATATAKKGPLSAQTRVDKLAVKLNLTDAQKTALVPIFQAEIDARAKLKKTTLTGVDKTAAQDKIRKDLLAKIKASGILTDAQYAQLVPLETPAKKSPTTAKSATPVAPAAN